MIPASVYNYTYSTGLAPIPEDEVAALEAALAQEAVAAPHGCAAASFSKARLLLEPPAFESLALPCIGASASFQTAHRNRLLPHNANRGE